MSPCCLPYRRFLHLSLFPFRKSGGDERDRTDDPLLAKQVLSQLSYTPIFGFAPQKLNNDVSFLLIPLTLDVNQLFSKLIVLHRKEVIQPHLPIRLPCYDFTPVANPTFGSVLLKGQATDFGYYRLPWCDGRCVQGPGTYSPRPADSRLLAIPTS